MTRRRLEAPNNENLANRSRHSTGYVCLLYAVPVCFAALLFSRLDSGPAEPEARTGTFTVDEWNDHPATIQLLTSDSDV